MRWSNLTTTADDSLRLPGHEDAATVRRFDAPEALDMRFYEIRARSAINRVPNASRMPFRWTINPYRGCSHACVYCQAGDTPILMADGRTRPLQTLRAGDEIYGTVGRGRLRRLVRTRVLAWWSAIKPAYRVALEDGTELIASGDHRYLTAGGWKYVLGSCGGRGRRPQLTASAQLVGTGRSAPGPRYTADYERGYLCGLIRGDEALGSRANGRPAGRWRSHVCGVSLARADVDAIERAGRYLSAHGVHPPRFAAGAGSARGRPAQAIAARARGPCERVRGLIRWPLDPSDEWRKGFLAGILDAAGACAGAIRLGDADATLPRWVRSCARELAVDAVLEVSTGRDAGCAVRLRGGLRERLRLLQLVDPASRSALDLEGLALEADASTRVAEITPLAASLRLFDITTGTGDFLADGIVSHNCFARPTHTYLDFDAGRDFEREIVVKVNAPEVVRAELRRPSWRGEHVALGTNTDPYQWVESRYKLMPGIWEAFRDARNPCSILTKSPLLLRDVGLLTEVAAVTDIHANLSIPTLDPKAWRATEPHTPHPRARLEAVAELNRAGIPTGVVVAPLMPGVNDAPEQLEPLLEAAAEAGATGIGGIALHLRGDVRELFFAWLREHRPDLVERYERLYARGAYAPPQERARLAALLRCAGAPPPSRFPADDRTHPAGAGEELPDEQTRLF